MELTERFRLQEVLETMFIRRRNAFIDEHGLNDKPALILQCLPAAELALDLQNVDLHAAMTGGGGPGAQDGWWNAFKLNGRPALTFDGLTGLLPVS